MAGPGSAHRCQPAGPVRDISMLNDDLKAPPAYMHATEKKVRWSRQ